MYTKCIQIRILFSLHAETYRLSYAEQIENKWRNLKMNEKRNLTGTEFLPHFRKGDKIKPVLMFVFFYGDEWDGNLELYDMLEWDEETNKEILHEYRQNLIEYFGYDESLVLEL